MLIPLKPGAPLYRQIYAFIRSAILSGRFPSGSHLPSTRSLARQLNVSRTVVLLSFDQLLAEGYIRGVRGSGTVVADGVPQSLERIARSGPEPLRPSAPAISRYATRLLAELSAQPRGPALRRDMHLYDFHYGNREAVDFPYRLWRRLASRRIARAAPSRSPTAGFPPLTEALAEYLSRTRGVRCEPSQIVVVNGSQQALDLLARILVDPGDRVILEEPHYHGARLALRGAGARLVPVRVDDDGLRVNDLSRLKRPARAVYLTPSHQFPTGAVLPLPRRLALINWAEQHAAYLIEDDYDGELRYDCRPIEAVQALDRTGRVIYIGTFSKALSPELRLGYVVAPPQLLNALTAAKHVTDLFTPTMLQEVLADFLIEGHYERHLRRLRDRNAARRQALLAATATYLGDRAVIAGVKAGMHAMLWLPTVPLEDLPTLVAHAEQAGVIVYANTNYYLGRPPRSGVVLSFSSLSEAEIHEGIRLFGKVVLSRW